MRLVQVAEGSAEFRLVNEDVARDFHSTKFAASDSVANGRLRERSALAAWAMVRRALMSIVMVGVTSLPRFLVAGYLFDQKPSIRGSRTLFSL